MSLLKNRTRPTVCLGAGLIWLCVVPTEWAAGDETKSTESASTGLVDAYNLPQESRAEVLAWFDAYLRRHVLFSDEDVKAMRNRITEMPTDEFHEWLVRTRQLRAELSSPEWLETETWLQETLRVQATYSDDEIAEFRRKAGQMSSIELLKLMDEIRDKHKSLQWRNRAFAEQRQSQVIARDRMMAQRSAAQRSAAARTRQSHALYGASPGRAARRGQSRPYAASQPTRYNRPLITSREVARRSVRRAVGSRW